MVTVITIKYDDQSGAIQVDGAPLDPVKSFGILEMTKDAVRMMIVQANQRKVQPAGVADMMLADQRFGQRS